MINVLHLCESSDTGGAESVLIALVESLDKGRFRSTVCLLKEGWLSEQLERRGIDTAIIPQPRSLDIAWLWQLYKLLGDRKIHVMHSHEFATNVYASLISAITQIPVVATAHGKNYYAEKLRRRLAYRFVAWQATMVAVSCDLREFLVQRVGIPRGHVRVVHNGIDLSLFKQHEHDGSIRKEFCIGEKQPIVGAIGNLFLVKGQTYLLRASKIVAKEYPGLVVLIAGDGDQATALRAEAVSLGIADNVKFLGFRSDVPSLLQAMDVFVLPSLSEGLPLSVLEALAYKKPVVVTNVGGVGEIVTDGVNGLMVPSEDPEALAEKILNLLNDPDLGVRLGCAGRDTVEAAFSLEMMVARYQALYESSCS